VVQLPSGLQYQVLKKGDGPSPKATDRVKTHYHGTLIDGTVFDSSVESGQPVSFGVNEVIPGWTEALQLMKVGDKWRLFIPADLAYGVQGVPPDIGPNSVLIFEIELLGIE
jgi:FKBP-type peptidyl-prolyl cis-trans isomerase FklB